MTRWFWTLLALSAVVIAVALAVAQPGGQGNNQVYAAPPDLTVSLDMDASTADGGPCADIDSSASHDSAGANYTVAICVTGLYVGYPIGSFSFDVLYNDTLNAAPEVADSGTALDDNPDANAGVTFWGDGLGPGGEYGWDCSNIGLAYPTGDKDPASGAGHGDTFIACDSLGGPWTLGDNETAGVIATIEFDPIAAGTDNLTIKTTSYLAYPDTNKMGGCEPTDPYVPIDCVGGTDIKAGPTPTNTPATPTVTATPTPYCGGEGQPACPTSTATRKPWTITPTPVTPTPTPAPSACLDLNGDGRVDGGDISIVARALFSEPGDGVADVNGDGKVDLVDLFLVIRSSHHKQCQKPAHHFLWWRW